MVTNVVANQRSNAGHQYPNRFNPSERRIERCENCFLRSTIRPRKVDFVVAVGIWVGFGPELGSEKKVRK